MEFLFFCSNQTGKLEQTDIDYHLSYPLLALSLTGRYYLQHRICYNEKLDVPKAAWVRMFTYFLESYI